MMVSRATHYQNKARHAQRSMNQPKATLPDNDSWFSAGLQAVGTLHGLYGSSWSLAQAVPYMGADIVETDRRLRHFCKLGILRMSALKDEDGKFVEFRFALADPSLHS